MGEDKLNDGKNSFYETEQEKIKSNSLVEENLTIE